MRARTASGSGRAGIVIVIVIVIAVRRVRPALGHRTGARGEPDDFIVRNLRVLALRLLWWSLHGCLHRALLSARTGRPGPRRSFGIQDAGAQLVSSTRCCTGGEQLVLVRRSDCSLRSAKMRNCPSVPPHRTLQHPALQDVQGFRDLDAPEPVARSASSSGLLARDEIA
jgi:hypothetical protein